MTKTAIRNAEINVALQERDELDDTMAGLRQMEERLHQTQQLLRETGQHIAAQHVGRALSTILCAIRDAAQQQRALKDRVARLYLGVDGE